MRDWISEVNSNPLPVELFMELVEISVEALEGKLRVLPPDDERCLDELPPNTIVLTDIPENQMGMAVVRECRRRFKRKKAQLTSQSFLFRWFAILDSKKEGALTPFTKKIDGGELVNDAIFKAAADSPIAENGKFGGHYIQRIRAIMRECGESEFQD